jgi:GTP cyclohydrolase FolE2
MKARDLQNIPDVQATPDSRKLAIDKVGIKAIRHPIQIKERSGASSTPSRPSTCTSACRTTSRARTCRASSRS